MLDFGFYNMDCMQGMKEFPDNYFDLAIVGPPYGAGFTEGGGCKGWFSKYHQEPENPNGELGVHFNGRGRFKKYETAKPLEELERVPLRGLDCDSMVEVQSPTILGINTCERTGGTWAKKYGKKSYRGTLPLEENTLKNSFASHEIKLYGAAIILNFHRQDALWFGVN